MTSSSSNLSEDAISTYFVAFSALLTLVLLLSKILHDAPKIASFLPEAGMTLLVGMIAGFFVNMYADTEEASGDVNIGGDDDAAVDVEVAESLLSFSPQVFFVALLPPIIFNSGYHLRRAIFFRHITPICLLACVGTTVSALSIALVLELVKSLGWTGTFQPTFTELLTFGGLISATDPVSTLAVFQAKRVDPQLFYLVFGESVLNDAVGLVLFNSFAHFVRQNNKIETIAVGVLNFFLDFLVSFVGSLLLGLLAGIVAAFVLKVVDMRSTPLVELSLYVLIMYVPYMLAEILDLSGIVTILFTGIAARRFIVPNLSTETVANADTLFRLAAHIAETSIFLELGLSVFGFTGGGNFVWQFVLWSLLACLVARALNVYPIIHLHNMFLTKQRVKMGVGSVVAEDGVMKGQQETSTRSDPTLTRRINIGTGHMLWFSGLRGAVAYACVRTFPNTFGHRKQFVITTMTIVLVTVFFMGGATESMLKLLRIDVNVDEDLYMEVVAKEHQDNVIGRIGECIRRAVVRPPDQGNTIPTETKPDSPLADADYQVHTEDVTTDNIELVPTPKGKNKSNKPESLYDYGKGGSTPTHTTKRAPMET